MKLLEVILASVVFSLASSVSLQVWSSGARWTLQAEEQRQQLMALDAEVLGLQARLHQYRGQLLAQNCATAASWLAAALPPLPALPQLERKRNSRKYLWLGLAAGLAGTAAAVSLQGDDPSPSKGTILVDVPDPQQ